jgi:hypothetical protein
MRRGSQMKVKSVAFAQLGEKRKKPGRQRPGLFVWGASCAYHQLLPFTSQLLPFTSQLLPFTSQLLPLVAKHEDPDVFICFSLKLFAAPVGVAFS